MAAAADEFAMKMSAVLAALAAECHRLSDLITERPAKKEAVMMPVTTGSAETVAPWRALEELVLEGKLSLETPGHANMVFRACGDEDEEINTRAERVVLQLSRRWGEDPTRHLYRAPAMPTTSATATHSLPCFSTHRRCTPPCAGTSERNPPASAP